MMKQLSTSKLAFFIALIGVSLLGSRTGQAQTGVAVDATFGNGGHVLTGLTANSANFSQTSGGNPNWMIMGQAITLGNGKVVAVAENANTWTVKCYLPTGAPDSDFGTNGSVTTAFPGGNSGATGVVVQPDGKLVVVGGISGDIGRVWAAARYSPQGVLDPTFGTGGLAYPANISRTSPSELARVAVLADGSLLGVASYGRSYPTRLLKLTAAGQPDTSFGPTGFGPSYNGLFEDLVAQPDGKLLLAVDNYQNGGQYARLVRYTAAGQPDPTFGTNGEVNIQGRSILAANPNPTTTFVRALAVQPDGKIVLAGNVSNGQVMGSPGDSPLLLRLNADGTPDTDFNTATYRSLVFTGGLAAVAVQADGKLLVGGSANRLGTQLLLARYTAAGTLDPTFATSPAGSLTYPNGVYAGPIGDGTLVRSFTLPAAGQLLAWEQTPASAYTSAMRLTHYTLGIVTASRVASPASFQLTVRPVPTTGRFTVQYTLPAATAIRLTLRDQLGRIVAQAAPGWQLAGAQELSFAAGQVAPGSYVCVLEAAGLHSATRVVILP